MSTPYFPCICKASTPLLRLRQTPEKNRLANVQGLKERVQEEEDEDSPIRRYTEDEKSHLCVLRLPSL